MEGLTPQGYELFVTAPRTVRWRLREHCAARAHPFGGFIYQVPFDLED
jgi:hypothetical protein